MQKFSHELGLDLSLTKSNKLNLVGLELDNNKYTKDSKVTKNESAKMEDSRFYHKIRNHKTPSVIFHTQSLRVWWGVSNQLVTIKPNLYKMTKIIIKIYIKKWTDCIFWRVKKIPQIIHFYFILNIFENFPAHQVDSNFAKINLTTLVTNHSWLLHFCNLLLKIIVF